MHERAGFLQLTLDYSLVLVHQPTRGNSTLDVVFVSDPDCIGAIFYSEGFSDHALLNLDIIVSSCMRETINKRIFDYNRANYNTINLGLQSFSDTFLPTVSQRPVSDNWLLFKDTFNKLMQTHIP